MKVPNDSKLFPFRVEFDGKYIVRQCADEAEALSRAKEEFGENHQFEISEVE